MSNDTVSAHIKKNNNNNKNVDLEKAFDRLRWEFIEDTLLDIGLPQPMINLIMQCLTSSSMQVLWNGKPSSTFKPQRGIRQVILYPPIFLSCAWKDFPI